MNKYIVKGFRKINNSYRRYKNDNWEIAYFRNLSETIIDMFNMYHSQSYHYIHKHAQPKNVYHYHDDRNIILLNDVYVWPQTSLVAIDKNTLIKDSAYSNHRFKQFVEDIQFNKQHVLHENEPCAAIECGQWNNYYHWYIDTISRLYGLYHPKIQRIKNVKLYISDDLPEERLMVLNHLIPSNVEIKFFYGQCKLKAKTYIHLPYLTSEWTGHLPQDYLDFYKKSISSLFNLSYNNKKKINIYISRKYASVRNILNENLLFPILQRNGFGVYYLENMRLRDQVELFMHADCILGQHGAGLTNMIYSKDANIIEIFSTNYPGVNHYRLLASSLNFNYGNIHADKIFRPDELQVPWKTPYKIDHINKDIEVDVEKIEEKILQIKNYN